MGSNKIMIVEDNSIVAQDCRICLENIGYTVTSTVASGEESIIRAEQDRPDLILMDIHLRDEMDGIKAAEQIYSRFGIPVLFLSAYSEKSLLQRAKMVGSYGYIVKPFNENDLYPMVEMAISKAKMDKERRMLEARAEESLRLEAIGNLAGGIAHHFNNNLSVIRGYLELLNFGFSKTQEAKEYYSEMDKAVHRMLNLTNQLLAYSGGGNYKPQEIVLAEFIRESVNIIEPSLKSTVELSLDIPNDIHMVKADPVQLQMILSGLITNAEEGIEGFGTINVSYQVISSDHVSSHGWDLEEGEYIGLVVLDNGMGMDEKTRKRLFDPFFTTKFYGRGLGMAAIRGIVENHSGHIQVDSQVGEGTRVTVLLPLVSSVMKH